MRAKSVTHAPEADFVTVTVFSWLPRLSASGWLRLQFEVLRFGFKGEGRGARGERLRGERLELIFNLVS